MMMRLLTRYIHLSEDTKTTPEAWCAFVTDCYDIILRTVPRFFVHGACKRASSLSASTKRILWDIQGFT